MLIVHILVTLQSLVLVLPQLELVLPHSVLQLQKLQSKFLMLQLRVEGSILQLLLVQKVQLIKLIYYPVENSIQNYQDS